MEINRPTNALNRLKQDFGIQTIPTINLEINAQNIRHMFRYLGDLNNYLPEIGFPENAFHSDQLPLDWLQEVNLVHPKQHAALTKVVALALSNKNQGQLQQIGAIQEDHSMRIVFGSTRAMACHLLKRKIDIKSLKRSDELYELKQHIFANIK